MNFPRRPAAGETHVWIVDSTLLEPHGRPLRALARDDSPRALGRGFLRVLLGAYLDVPPPEVPVERRCPACGGGHGPPVANDLNISVSYTAGWVAYAIATAPVGIDIELMRPDYEWQSAACHVLPKAVSASIAALPAHQRTCAFYRAWTAREALAKAVGLGIAVAPDELDAAAAGTAADWTVTALAAGPGHVASLVAAGAGVRVRERGWVPVARLLG